MSVWNVLNWSFCHQCNFGSTPGFQEVRLVAAKRVAFIEYMHDGVSLRGWGQYSRAQSTVMVMCTCSLSLLIMAMVMCVCLVVGGAVGAAGSEQLQTHAEQSVVPQLREQII